MNGTSDDAPELRVVFMGTPAFAVPSLRALLDAHNIAGRPARLVAVVTQPDRPAGRGGRVQLGPVKSAALAAGIPVLQPERLRRPESMAELRSYAPDLIVVAAFAQILSREVLELPRYGCLNVHASLLPRWRGASPIAAAILAGDASSGVTIMKMDAGLDTGPLLAVRAIALRADETTGTLTARLAELGAELLAETLGPWIGGALTPAPQDDAQATLTRTLRKEDGRIDWHDRDAGLIARMTRAYDPWPGAFTTYAGRTLKLWLAEALAEDHAALLDRSPTTAGAAPPDDASTTTDAAPPGGTLANRGATSPDGTLAGDRFAVPGYALADGVIAAPGHVLTRAQATPLLAAHGLRWPQILVACRSGLLWVRRVQAEGKRPMPADEFMRGHAAIAGAQLGD